MATDPSSKSRRHSAKTSRIAKSLVVGFGAGEMLTGAADVL
jgi:hypothetical protein